MADSSSQPTLPVFSPGLLITHDWRQIHTECHFLDTVIQKVDSSSEKNFHTVKFPITSACQYETFVNGLGRYDVQGGSSCPIQLVSKHACETCSNRPISAFVKMIYHVAYKESALGQETFSADAESALKSIQEYSLMTKKAQERAFNFLRQFGSHYQRGVQKLGRYFYWVGMVEEECNMEILKEITDKLFTICEKESTHLFASKEGYWYSPEYLLKCDSWTKEKKDILKSMKLQVAQHGSSRTTMNLQEWKKDTVTDHVSRIHDITVDIIPAWELIRKHQARFNLFDWLANIIQNCWNQMVTKSQYSIYWNKLLGELDLQNYCSGKLSLQNVRSLYIKSAKTIRKQDLPWAVLEQIILMKSHCRENSIHEVSKGLPKKMSPNVLDSILGEVEANIIPEVLPHPMDMILLLFTCSDFMLRQVLAFKLFMCQLAIPFIVRTPDDKIEMLLWPLRSIVVEWEKQNHEVMEEALVSCKMHMIVCMRYGKTTFSKSKMINSILSSSGHSVFFHKEGPCGREKRLISNGTVEMSHCLPSGSKQDPFKEPALFFNLRGDAYDYQVQHSILMDLASVLVIIIDVGEVHKGEVNEMLKLMSNKTNIIFVLTNSTRLSMDDMVQAVKTLRNLVGEAASKDTLVPTFEEGGLRNATDLTEDIIKAIEIKMMESHKRTVEDLGKSNGNYIVDEIMNNDCSRGKHIAKDIVSDMCQIEIHERKKQLLPQQGESLHKIRNLLRNLHRNSSKDESLSDKDQIKSQMTAIRESQFQASQKNDFIKKVISVFDNSPATQEFALRWLQLELDAISRSYLPQLHKEKNKKWHDLTKARTDHSPRCAELEQDLQQAEMKISAATCGLEHIMREMAQIYNVAKLLNQDQKVQCQTVSHLPTIVARLLLEGHPTELMDGDHGILPLAWIKDVFHSLVHLIGKDKRVFVLSIMGIQSSGKSTLLNTMFGLQFAVSAGRCSRGIFAQLLPTMKASNLPFDYMLVLDSEGLRAQSISRNLEYDNEMATLIIGLADVTLINVKGESMAEVKDILQIVVHAFLRMNQAECPHRRQCMFVHQNVSAKSAQTKLASDRQQLQQQLDTMTKEASGALGIPETITAFSHVISFDCQRDVVYFSDLWHGNPPMATINQEYSTRAAGTRDTILEQTVVHFPRCIGMSDFPDRVKDMWHGVLADDFIFSFRNSLAAKAYIEVEQEFSRLTLKAEENLSVWVNQSCNIKIQNCSSEHDLESCIMKLHISLNQRVLGLLGQQLESLKKFFDNHRAQDIVSQWKSEKEASLRVFYQTVEGRMKIQMDNMRTRQVFKLRQQSAFHDHEQQLMEQAISLAQGLRGKCPSDKDLLDQFDKIWNPFESYLVSTYSLPPSNVTYDLRCILGEVMNPLGYDIYLYEQYKVTPLEPDASLNTIVQQDVSKDHIMLKSGLQKMLHGKTSFLETAAEFAKDMMDVVVKKVQEICEQDVMFHKLHGRHTVELVVQRVAEHNAVQKFKFSFTPQFIAFFAVRVACYAAAHFDKMNQRFEERYGVQAKLNDYKPRVYLLFKNTVEEKSAEIVLADNFCEAIKGTLLEFIRIKLDFKVETKIYQEIGTSKYDLITQILDGFIKDKNVTELLSYVSNPYGCAREWMQQFGCNLIFNSANEQTHYSELANCCVDEIIADVKASTEAASQEVLGITDKIQHSTSETDKQSTSENNPHSIQETDPHGTRNTDEHSTKERDQHNTPEDNQHTTWLKIFCDQMRSTAPIEPEDLGVTINYKINHFAHYQKAVEQSLQKLEEDMKDEFLKTEAETVKWADVKSPFQKACDRLWGCTAVCPFCKEPCQYTDPNHKTPHRCIQHRPPGIRGIEDMATQYLTTEICSAKVTSKTLEFECSVCDNQCQKSTHCKASGTKVTYHSYRNYKKFFPRWDIAPDSTGEASKFWQWAMHTYREKLLEKYLGSKLEIPDSWKGVTETEASESLRIYFS